MNTTINFMNTTINMFKSPNKEILNGTSPIYQTPIKGTLNGTSSIYQTPINGTLNGSTRITFPEFSNRIIQDATSAATYVNINIIAPATLATKKFALNHSLPLAHVGSAIGGAIVIGSTVKAVRNLKANPTYQGVKKELPTLALIGAGALLAGLSQLGASNQIEQVALAVTSLAFGVFTGTIMSTAALFKHKV